MTPSPWPIMSPTFTSKRIIPYNPTLKMKLLFNNNTYYKPGSLSVGTATTVRNSSTKSRRI